MQSGRSAHTPSKIASITGQLDEPLVVTDASMAKVWDAYVEPFGKAQVFGTPAAGLDLRLPGQWLEAEAGLHQNWHRSYDPQLGRYLQADPLGIEAGQNLYAYVDGRPLNAADPEGLDAYVLQQSSVVGGNGYTGILIGNKDSGYQYASKDGYGKYSYPPPYKDFETARSALRGRYDRAVKVPVTSREDKIMRTVAATNVRTPYSFPNANCGDLIIDVLYSINIPVCQHGGFGGGRFTVPNSLMNELRMRVGNFRGW